MSFHKMQIHQELLRTQADITADVSTIRNSHSHQTLKQVLDEWYVRWKELIKSLSDNSLHRMLGHWGELHYHHGLVMLSMLWPGAGGDIAMLCNNISTSCVEMVQHQQLFTKLESGGVDDLPILFPITWTTAHIIPQAGLHLIASEDCQTCDQNFQRASALRICLTALSALEADPNNLVTGQRLVIRNICLAKGYAI
jgi:hypothetical protein